jgi:hypothetical protein
LCKTAQLHAHLSKLSEHYAVFGEINGEDRIISKGLWPLRSPDLNACDFYLWGKLTVLCMPTIRMIWSLWNRIFVKQFTTLSNVNCNKFPEICLKEFRYVSQQRADILNIFYGSEYSINYDIWLIINERNKHYVLTVPAACKHFYRQVTQWFRRKLPTGKSVSNQPVLWTPDITQQIPHPAYLTDND